uniref:Agrin-like n=1 Tax=Heterorhabditis bacteriophora TaxID=37862 RepID=A0A1I7XAX0_HETBA
MTFLVFLMLKSTGKAMRLLRLLVMRLLSTLSVLLYFVKGCYRYPKEKHHPCEDLRCGPGEDCVVTQSFQNKDVLSAQCICPKLCPNYGDSVDSSPVCSSDGVDYHSLCHMKQHACETKTNITVKYFGKCDPCAQMKCGSSTQCKLSEQRRPLCRCSQQCSLHHDPVCADDGNTYSNECVMHVAACKDDLQLSVFKKGKCEGHHNNPCSNINCSWGSSCHISKNGTAECRCNKKCELILKPVCGTNGITYDNECELRRLSCEEKSRIEVHHEGTCGPLNVLLVLNYIINYFFKKFRDYIYRQLLGLQFLRCLSLIVIPLCRPGVGGLKCDHCLPGFWGIHLIANGAMSCQRNLKENYLDTCGCSAFGSTRADCEQSTGRCECLRGAVGDKCDKCHDDMVMTAGGCVIKEEYKTPRYGRS